MRGRTIKGRVASGAHGLGDVHAARRAYPRCSDPPSHLSDWGAGIHAGYRSVTGTASLRGQSAQGAIRNLANRSFAVA